MTRTCPRLFGAALAAWLGIGVVAAQSAWGDDATPDAGGAGDDTAEAREGDRTATIDGAGGAEAREEDGAAGDEEDGAAGDEEDALAAPVPEAADEPEVRYGLGVRMRYLHIPTDALEFFVERSAGGASHPGIGVELVRESGSLVVALGVEYENVAPRDGVYIAKGDRIPQNTVDYIEYEDFDWISADLTFIWQPKIIGDVVSLRFGGGLGVGYFLGEMLRTDYVCTGSEVESCSRDPQGELDRTPDADMPPIFPIVNVLAGVRIQPFSNLAINLEGGIRTIPFAGTTVSLLF